MKKLFVYKCKLSLAFLYLADMFILNNFKNKIKGFFTEWFQTEKELTILFNVAQYNFSGSIPPKFEYKLHRHKQRFGKINTTAVLDKDENLL